MKSEIEQLRIISKAYEKKLRELMGEEEFREFSTQIVRGMIADDLCKMPDSDFKELILNHFDQITGSDEDFAQLVRMIQPSKDCADCIHCNNIDHEQKIIFCDLESCVFEEKKDDEDGFI